MEKANTLVYKEIKIKKKKRGLIFLLFTNAFNNVQRESILYVLTLGIYILTNDV